MEFDQQTPCRLTAGEQGECGVVPSPYPVLSWVPAAKSVVIPEYEIEAVIGNGEPQRAAVGRSLRIRWPFVPIPSRSLARWRVRETGGEWSRWSVFRSALWAESDWAARWISPLETAEHRSAENRGGFVLRRTFTLEHPAESATLYATALGVYDAALNGARIGEVELAPGFTSYDRTLHAQAYNVAGHLRVGENVLEFTVTDGWYRGRNGGAQPRNAWGDTLGLLARLDIETSSGLVNVVTDEDWTTTASPVIRADLMRGQTSDLRRSCGDPLPVEVDLVTAPVPTWSPAPAVRRIEKRPTLALTSIDEGISLLDAGQNLTGWVQLRDLGPEGAETVLEYAEHLAPDGDITTEHLDMMNRHGEKMSGAQIDSVISDGSAAIFEPRHTVHGFRYVRITHHGRTLALEDTSVVVVHSDLPATGTFQSNSTDLNDLHAAAVWSFRGNVVDIPTDCPTRERSGWTGDFQVFVPTAAQLYDIDGFATKWLQSVRDDQAESGIPAAFSPDSERSKLNPAEPTSITGGSAGWGDALIEVPWVLYRSYGDTDILAASWDSMVAFLEYALTCARTQRHRDRIARRPEPEPHEAFIWDAPFHYGEWLEPKKRRADGTLIDPMAEDVRAYFASDRGEVGTAYLFRSLDTLARIALVLSLSDEAERYSALAEKVRDAWRTEFLLNNGRTHTDTQAAYVRALAFDLIPAPLRPAASARLATLIEGDGDHLGTGFLSTGMLLPVLAENGYPDLAHRVLMQRNTPSWLNMLAKGATTMWEDWDGVTDDGQAHESLNHYSKGAVIRFLHEYVAGVRQSADSVAWERFVVEPTPSSSPATEASYRLLTPRGLLEATWTDAEQFVLSVLVPPTAQATAFLPDRSVHTLGPGRHTLRCAGTTHADT